MAITIKTEEEIEILKQGGKILSDVLKELEILAKPGISTGFLNQKAREMILTRGALPSFEGYKSSFSDRPYPAAMCVSLNNVVVHGLPSEKVVLKEGDILKLDLGVKYKNFFTDAALTIGIGKMTDEKNKLINVTKRALELAVNAVKPGNHIGDIGYVIENYVEREGLSVVRVLVGHGVGYAVHEEPSIPNYGKIGEGPILKSGMVLAIEPMVTLESGEVKLSKDGFGYETVDGSFSAHFEHTVAVTDDGCLVLTK
ncbi:MAG: type I methionyl aminopeptidase [Candidatus Azambacteria bacterium]|nr:type I methionyl aminopeptidase [Candidatus Azambacteria bacterium]